MNDCISILNYELQRCRDEGRGVNEIYFHSPIYDFSQYFDISGFNYLRPDEKVRFRDFDRVNKTGEHQFSFDGFDNDHHVSNFLKLKKEILDKFEEYNDHVGIHCRVCYPSGATLNTFLKNYLPSIEKVIEDNEKVSIFSDYDEIYNHLPCGEEVYHEYTGAFCMDHPLCRRDYLRETINDIVKMGKCKRLYATRGSFWKLPKMFVNRELPVIDLLSGKIKEN
jgi:hypothetical protein